MIRISAVPCVAPFAVSVWVAPMAFAMSCRLPVEVVAQRRRVVPTVGRRWVCGGRWRLSCRRCHVLLPLWVGRSHRGGRNHDLRRDELLVLVVLHRRRFAPSSVVCCAHCGLLRFRRSGVSSSLFCLSSSPSASRWVIGGRWSFGCHRGLCVILGPAVVLWLHDLCSSAVRWRQRVGGRRAEAWRGATLATPLPVRHVAWVRLAPS